LAGARVAHPGHRSDTMDFARQQRDPTKHLIGIAFVVLFHLALIYALLTGLGRTMIEVIKKPISATIVEEIKAPPPPPPPPKKIVETPKVQTPVQTYVPPPDIPVPTTAEPVISAPTTAVAPTEPHVIAPPPVVEAPPPPSKPAIRKGITPIKKEEIVYPRAAARLGIEKGHVVARLMIDEKGNVTNVTIVSADPPKHFDKAVIDALMEWKFSAEGAKYVGEIEVNFTMQ
jgi:protein TonB